MKDEERMSLFRRLDVRMLLVSMRMNKIRKRVQAPKMSGRVRCMLERQEGGKGIEEKKNDEEDSLLVVILEYLFWMIKG
jgi:hypothetical protein